MTGYGLKYRRVDLDYIIFRKKFFTLKVVRHWHRWLTEVGDVPSLELPKAMLDRALSNTV